jgi:hypothetical protein
VADALLVPIENSGRLMNQTRLIAVTCSALLAVLLGGCGGGNSGNATIGGNVSGLAPNTTVTLTDNGGAPISISANGSFTFPGTIASAGGYKVEVKTQPAGQNCLVTYGSGVIDFSGNNVTNVAVVCSGNVQIGTKVAGLAAGNTVTFSLTLQNDPNNISSLPVTTNGVINNFSVLVPLGYVYDVAVSVQPGGNASPTQVCTVDPQPTTPPSAPFSGGVVSSNALTVDFTCR